jgi:pheromone shutdown protein TraB
VSESPDAGSVTVVGTAHVSAESAEEVERVVEAEEPDVVAVELDESRYRQLEGETPDDLDPADLLKGSVAVQFLAYWLLSYVQSRLGEKFDVEPGADMKAGVDAAERVGAGVALVDRDIQTTIQRFWARLSAGEKLRLVGQLAVGATDPWTVGAGLGAAVGLFVGVVAAASAGPLAVPAGVVATLSGLPVGGLLVFALDAVAVGLVVALGVALTVALVLVGSAPEGEPEDLTLEEMTDADVVSAMMEQFREFSPGGAEALIDERDAYIAHNLVGLREQGADVVAVVGAGHREGIEAYLDDPDSLPPMSSLTGTESGGFSVSKALGYLLTLGFVAFFALLVLAGIEQTVLLKVFAAWFLFNGVIAFSLARLAGAHWTSATVGGAVAWLTSLNPLLAPGWFAGYVELRRRPVNVSDIGRLNDIMADEETPVRELTSQLLSVPLFRLIVVVAMTNLGSLVASVLFPFVVLPAIGGPFDSVGAVTAAMERGIGNGIDLLVGAVT